MQHDRGKSARFRAPSHRTPLLLILALLLPLDAAAQQDGSRPPREPLAKPEAPDSMEVVLARADSARAELVQPPGSYGGVRAMDLIRVPFQLFGATLTLGLAAVGIGYEIADELLIKPGMAARNALAKVDIEANVGTMGPRSYPAVTLRYVGLRPFFVEAGYSLRQYQHYGAGAEVGDTTLGAEVTGTYRRMREPHFYGVGPDSRWADRSDYGHDVTRGGGVAWWDLGGSPLTLSAGGGWERNEVGRGGDDDHIDVHDAFPPATLFGLEHETEYLTVEAGADLDLTHVRHLQVRGFRALGSWRYYDGVDGTASAFHRVAGDVRIFVPANERQLVALRLMAEDHLAEKGNGVPFTHLAQLGDDDGLRGHTSRRFRDRALVAAQAEWRYEAWWHPGYPDRRVEGFAFIDTGTVGPSLGDVDLSDFKVTPGLGVRWIVDGNSLVEGYVAFGGGGPRLDVEFGRTF